MQAQAESPLFDIIKKYEQCKKELRAGATQFIRAIQQIRDERLYRVEYDTFEEFCQKELGRTRGRINQLIRAVDITDDLNTIGIELNERQSRELIGLTPEQRRDTLAVAFATAPDGKVTAGWIQSTAIVLKGLSIDPNLPIGNDEVYGTPLHAAITQETYERMQRQQDHIKEGRSKPVVNIVSTYEACATDLATALGQLDPDLKSQYRIVVYEVK